MPMLNRNPAIYSLKQYVLPSYLISNKQISLLSFFNFAHSHVVLRIIKFILLRTSRIASLRSKEASGSIQQMAHYIDYVACTTVCSKMAKPPDLMRS